MQEIHVWLTLDGAPKETAVTYEDTVTMIERGTPIIHTTQTHFASLKYECPLYVHVFDETYQIKDSAKIKQGVYINKHTSIEKMIIFGQFGWYDPGDVR